MKYLKSFKLVVEKSIGSEEIRNKYYSDLPKKTFYNIINIDPTSIRKKEFSKPGKYSKWLLSQYKKKNLTDELLNNEDYKKRLNYYLFIFTTGWYKKTEKVGFYAGGEHVDFGKNDILKFSLGKFVSHISDKAKRYELETGKSKYDVIYSDNKLNVLIPLNFSASYETSKNTHWCTQSPGGFSFWSQKSILFRVIPKDKNLDRVKLSWTKDGKCMIACSEYPEIIITGNPFEKIDGVDRWDYERTKRDIESNPDKYKQDEKWIKNSKKIKETLDLLSDEAKNLIIEYYDRNKKI